MLERAIKIITELISMEQDHESKLDLLTNISIDTTSEEIYRASVHVRDNLPSVDSPGPAKVLRDRAMSNANNNSVLEKGANDNSGEAGNTTLEFTAFCLYVLACSAIAIWLGWMGYV